jgi:hypothetical protein
MTRTHRTLTSLRNKMRSFRLHLWGLVRSLGGVRRINKVQQTPSLVLDYSDPQSHLGSRARTRSVGFVETSGGREAEPVSPISGPPVGLYEQLDEMDDDCVAISQAATRNAQAIADLLSELFPLHADIICNEPPTVNEASKPFPIYELVG